MLPKHQQDALKQTTNQPNTESIHISSISKIAEIKEQPKPAHEIKAFTLGSLAKERELVKNTDFQTLEKAKYEVRHFSETDMLLQWTKFVQKMEEQGQMNLNAILSMNDPKLNDNYVISYEVPNESIKYEIDRNKTQLLGYLRGMLHNHDIHLELLVSEEAKQNKFYTPEDKYNHFKTLNPEIELLRQTFGLDF